MNQDDVTEAREIDVDTEVLLTKEHLSNNPPFLCNQIFVKMSYPILVRPYLPIVVSNRHLRLRTSSFTPTG